ncbi:invasion regulator SirB1 [Pantoea sp. 1.19]|uniref:invasion regulator SirB1 n=1 Tax=Pantoea sp. 1.19 TaxID=1925589 RepID=UPI000948BCDC|nr:invasion regulator SirB1 [Pantoea sp. 1.19]
MTAIAELDFEHLSLCDAVIEAMKAVRADLPAAEIQRQLASLVAEARQTIDSTQDKDQQLEQLLTLFYTQWGFGGSSGVYRLSDALWLDNVLQSRQGTAVSLGTLFLHIARALTIPVEPVIFPTQLILRADWVDGEMWLINPFNGDTLDEHTLEAWLKGNVGLLSELYAEDLDPASSEVVMRKMLDTLKAALMEEKQMERALAVSEILLQFDPEDPYEIRDRGLIYAQLDCEHVALNDLNYFIEQCPEDPISEMIKLQIHSIEDKQITLH